jgi:glycerol-3-phosphate dehydrogenase (NAD(P)+)
VAEGVLTAPTLVARARAAGVDMPITEAVAAVLGGVLSPDRALQQLMARDARSEG